MSAQCGYISKTENLLTLPIFIEKVDDSGKIMDRTVLYCMPIVVFFLNEHNVKPLFLVEHSTAFQL